MMTGDRDWRHTRLPDGRAVEFVDAVIVEQLRGELVVVASADRTARLHAATGVSLYPHRGGINWEPGKDMP